MAAVALDLDLDFVARFHFAQDAHQLGRCIDAAAAEFQDHVAGLELGADDYVLKPFSPVELTARVRRLIAGARTAGE